MMIDMKFNPEWLLRVAKEEEDVRFSVGGWVSDLEKEFGSELTGEPRASGAAGKVNLTAAAASESSDAKLVQLGNVFGQFLNMARREKGLSVQQLAQTVGMNPYDVLLLEEGKEFPEPRIVSKIAQVFDVPPRKLAQIAGHVVPDTTTARAALAFAASSSTKPLEPSQKEALHEFIKALSSM
ncbi:MAG: helix-turn-helix transcriptional regulator [Silvibacterium sp.]